MLAVGTLFLLGPILPHHQTRRGQIHDLATLGSTHGNRLQVVLTGFTPFYLLAGDLIWCARELQARSRVSWLPARFPLALLTQAFRLARETIRGRRQMAVMAVFAHALFQRVKALLQLSNQFVSLLQLLFQQGIFLFQLR